MKTSDLQRKHIFYKEHLVEVPIYFSLCDPVCMVLKGSKMASVLEAEGRMTDPRASENCVCVCMCFKENNPKNTIKFLCKYSIHCELLPLLCGTQFTYFWVQ